MPRIFIVKHPICEPRPSAPLGCVCVYPWKTTKGHNRRFIKRDGLYLDGGVEKRATLYFWGEYEAGSAGLHVHTRRPKIVFDTLVAHRGRISLPSDAQNTDPYVFGNHFKNICCGIRNRKYKPGDVVLFGNTKRNRDDLFLLDTVMVIKDKVPVNPALDFTQYYNVGIQPVSHATKFYRGEMFRPGCSYFSYVPCRLIPDVHPQPLLDLVALGFTPGSTAAIPFTPKRWADIIAMVKSAGWELGTHIDRV